MMAISGDLRVLTIDTVKLNFARNLLIKIYESEFSLLSIVYYEAMFKNT